MIRPIILWKMWRCAVFEHDFGVVEGLRLALAFERLTRDLHFEPENDENKVNVTSRPT